MHEEMYMNSQIQSNILNLSKNLILLKGVHINDKKIDDSMVSFFKGPKSFTGEDVMEINCHGGDFISKKIDRYRDKLI